MQLIRLIWLASLPLVGLAPLSATATPATGSQAPASANGGLVQVQYLEVDPAPPPAAVVEDDDDDDDYDTGRVIGRFQDEGLSRCAAQFRSFEPDTGYYTTYAGERVLCPYLQ
jgi:BA14K-like protein